MTALRRLGGILLIPLSLLAAASPALAYEELVDADKPEMTCDTACHLPENIIRAKENKFKKESCRECHSIETASKGISPFRRGKKILMTSASPRKPSGAAAKRAQAKTPSHAEEKEMAFVPAGEFIMGSNERWDDESPEHMRETRAFYIDYYEVSNRRYRKFVSAAKRPPPHHWADGEIPAGKENHPVTYVSWFDASDYCAWAGKRLPKEPEWEKASRGDDGLIYPWGDLWTLDKSNNPYKNSTGTETIGSYPEGRSPYGLYDMSGNVWEWVDAFYLPHPGNVVPSQEYGKDKRVLKGGSWFDCLSYGCGLSAPAFNRSFFNPEVKNNSFGFRCAKDATDVKQDLSLTKK